MKIVLILTLILGQTLFISSSFAFMPVWQARKNSWRTLSNSGAPPSTDTQQLMARVGSKVYLWGGLDSGNNTLSTGYIFDTATNSWSNMPTTGSPPTARYRHHMVAAGTKIIVWGGQTTTAASSRVNTGSIFDTVSNTWSAMTTGSAPSGRSYAATAWTGTHFFVWGGRDGAAAFLSDGKLYDIASNTWTTTVATTNAPSARDLLYLWQDSVGDKLMVWGGRTATSTCTNTGSLYDPSTNTWQVITTTGAPAARCFNITVWNGSRFFVWGGDTQGGLGTLLDSGGVYDPSSNTWSSTTTTNAPTARHWHSGYSTPSGFLVWGGTDGSGVVANGKLYDVTNNVWTTMSSTNSSSGDGADRMGVNFKNFILTFDGSIVRAYVP